MSQDNIAISANNLGKLYHLFERPQDRLKHALFWRFGKTYGWPLWALRGVSFEFRKGEAIGIIGRNGSGKSTLLQILAGILQPNEGEFQVTGRVASLLELGSGFNPEYNGRDNIFINGAILGLSRQEILDSLDNVIAFADIGEFIDQPVKLYSSGMFVRLAFSVAINQNADILLVDEALAVGDVFFRQKCYQHMLELKQKGVTILLVSHSMMDVEQFCDRAMVLDHGRNIFLGNATEAVKRYYILEQPHQTVLENFNVIENVELSKLSNDLLDREFKIIDAVPWPRQDDLLDLSSVVQVSNGWARFSSVALCDKTGKSCRVFQQGESAVFYYELELFQDIEVPHAGVEFRNDKGIIVHGKSTLEYGTSLPFYLKAGTRLRFRQEISLQVQIGEYTFSMGAGTLYKEDYDQRARMSIQEIDAKLIRTCLAPNVGVFSVIPRNVFESIPLLHHGVANLPGSCEIVSVLTTVEKG